MVASAAWSGQTQPEYETLLELGEGGMAIAYLARTLGAGGFERWVVLKRLNLELMANPEAIDRFLAEARVAARIHHANVVGTQHVGRDSAGPFIVLDYVEGGALDELVNAGVKLGAPLAPGVVLRIALDALSGLQAVHEAKDPSGRPLEILHRDISLENVLVSVHDGVARLSDFGVARSVLSPVRTSPGYFVGKLLYLAPEYLRREPVGPTLDIYALGVTLWLALAGDRPWRGLGDGQIVSAIVEDGFPPLPEHIAVPEEIRAFVAKACERDPARRFQSARDMKAPIEAFDRAQGAVASHAEVAECVELLLGQALHRRRLTLAERGRARTPARHAASKERVIAHDAPSALPVSEAPTDISPSPDALPERSVLPESTIVLPAPAAKPHAPSSVNARPPSRPATARLAAAVVALASVALAAALAVTRARQHAPTAPGAPAALRTIPAPTVATPAPPTISVGRTLVPAPASSIEPAASAASARSFPSGAPSPRRAPHRARELASHSPPPSSVPPPPASDGIQKRNPYR